MNADERGSDKTISDLRSSAFIRGWFLSVFASLRELF